MPQWQSRSAGAAHAGAAVQQRGGAYLPAATHLQT